VSSNSYSVNPILTATSFTASNAVAAPPQWQTLTYTVSGGTSPYTYNVYVYNSIGTVMDDTVNSASNTFTFQLTTTSLWSSGVYTANAVAEDSATTNELVYSSLHFLVCPGVTFSGLLSNSILDYGQYQALSVNVIGCQGPYTYNYMVYNPSGTLVYNSLFQTSQTYNTVLLSGNATGQWTANIAVTDSESTPMSYSESFTYNVLPQPSVLLRPASNIIDNGQSIILTANAYNGVAPYAYHWYVSSSGSASCTSANLISGAAAQTYTASPSSTESYAVEVIDSASTPETSCSSPSSITVNPRLSIASLIPLNPTYDIGTGGMINLSDSWSGGTPAYDANWSIYHYTGLEYNALYAGITAGSNSISVPLRLLGVGIFHANLSIKDSPSVPSTATSSNDTITINSDPTVLLTPNATTVANGAAIKFIAEITGGTGPFEIKLIAGNGTTIYTESGIQAGSTSIGPITPPLGNDSYNVLVTDTGAYIPYIFHSQTVTIDVQNKTANIQNTSGCTDICIHGSGGSAPAGLASTTTSATTASSSTTAPTTTAVATTVLLTTSAAPIPPIQVEVKPTGKTTSQLCENFNEEYDINYVSIGAVFKVSAGASGCFNMTAFNATPYQLNASNKIGHLLRAINFSISNKNMSAIAILKYPCNITSGDVDPFILRNRTWNLITPFSTNASACTVTFTVPSDPVIALFYNATGITSTNATASTTLQTSIPAVQKQTTDILWPILAIIILIVVLVFLYGYMRRRKSWRRKWI